MMNMRNKRALIPIFLAVTVMMTGIAVAANTGAVWAVDINGNRDDFFDPGTAIYVDGQKFPSHTKFTFTITDQDALCLVNAPCVKPEVANSNRDFPGMEFMTDSSGNINRIPTGFSIPTSDAPNHDYRLNVNIYSDITSDEFYTKRDTFYAIPEFPTVALPVAAVIGLVFLFHKRKSKEE